MSVNPSGSDTIDYSDFEYQQTQVVHGHGSLSGDGARSDAQFEIEVLDGIGGLDNNEVAELVWMEAQIDINHAQDDNDQDVGSETRYKGNIGANLNANASLVPGNGPNTVSTQEISTSSSTTQLGGAGTSDDRIFAPFSIIKHPAFDDQTNGPGGSGAAQTLVVQRPFRNMVGRGPVLDSSDEMSVVSRLIQEDEIILAQGTVNLHMVWDVAETSDAGRAFSVPMDD